MISPIVNECAHVGDQCSAVDHDLIGELSRRLDSLVRYDQYIANAPAGSRLKEFWCTMKAQEQQNIQCMKELLSEQLHKLSV